MAKKAGLNVVIGRLSVCSKLGCARFRLMQANDEQNGRTVKPVEPSVKATKLK